jgi:hypothetical protein
MPPYLFNLTQPVPMAIPGNPIYALGSEPANPPCRMLVSGVLLNSNVATLNVTIVEGAIPLVGDTLFVYATATASGAFNTSAGVTITGVSINSVTGVGTITYALTHANVGQTADAGYANTSPQEGTEALTSGQKSQAIAIQNVINRGSYGISWAYTFPSAPVSVSIQLEGAINNNDAEYTIIGQAQTTASGYNEIIATLPELVNFVRVHVTATSGGTNPTVTSKILVS